MSSVTRSVGSILLVVAILLVASCSTPLDEGLAIDSSGNVYAAGSGENIVGASNGRDWWIKEFNPDGTEVPAQ